MKCFTSYLLAVLISKDKDGILPIFIKNRSQGDQSLRISHETTNALRRVQQGPLVAKYADTLQGKCSGKAHSEGGRKPPEGKPEQGCPSSCVSLVTPDPGSFVNHCYLQDSAALHSVVFSKY